MWMEHLTGMVLGIAFWATIAAIVLVPRYLRSRDRARMHETLRIAYEKGQPVAPDLVTAMAAGASAYAELPTAERDLRRGVILIAAAVGMGALGYGLWYGLTGVDDISAFASGGWVAGVGAIVGLIGVVHLVFWLVRRWRPA